MTDKEDYVLLRKLKSNDSALIFQALIEIRKSYVRNFDKMRRLCKSSVIEILISYLEHPKFCNISLSIIADACMEKNLLAEVIQNGGIKPLIRIMKGLINDDIQNRACRALGNIAKSAAGFQAVLSFKPISFIIRFLNGTTNENCQQTAVRTLRILGKDDKSRDIIVKENGIIYIAQLLHSTSKEVLLCSTRSLADLTENCSIACAQQMLEMESLKALIKLCSHSEKDIGTYALTSLKNLAFQEDIRSDLIKSGAVKLFTEVAMSYNSIEMCRLATIGLCYCVDHLHMWGNYGVSQSEGMKAIVKALSCNSLEDIHICIIVAILPLCYEQGVPDTLLDLKIIEALLQILKKFIAHNKKEHVCSASQSSTPNNDASKVQADTENVFDDELSLSSIFSVFSSEDNLSMKEKCLEGPNFKNEVPINLSEGCSQNNMYPLKNVSHFNASYLHLHSSGASSNCSPFSSESYNAVSPLFSDHSRSPPLNPYDFPNPWSPSSNADDEGLCWSPVVSNSGSGSLESDSEMEPPHDDSETETFTNALSKNVQQSSMETITDSLSPEVTFSNISNSLDVSPIVESQVQTEESESEINMPIINLEKNDSSPPTKKFKAMFDLDNSDSPKSKTYGHLPNLIRKIKMPSKKGTIDQYVIVLLLQLSFHLEKKKNSEIASRSCFTTLMDYVSLIRNPDPRAEKLLINLVKNRYCFEKLIINGFVSEMEKRISVVHDLEVCFHCMQIKKTYNNLLYALRPEVESDYGVGTLCHVLFTTEKPIQIYAIHAISIITNLKSLYKLIIQGNCLGVLLNFLIDKQETTYSTAIISLCQLFQNTIKNRSSEHVEKCCFSKTCDIKVTSKCVYKDLVLDVIFCVNGIKVNASRQTICDNSDYFKALLEGHFCEKQKNVISMSEISAETLTTIFHFLHGCKNEFICPYIKRIPFAILLELLSESDKFLLCDVKSFVEDRLCHSLLPDTICRIYQSAKLFNSPFLCQKALQFLLSMDVSQKDILLKCFRELMNSDKDYNFCNDLKLIIQDIFPETNSKCS